MVIIVFGLNGRNPVKILKEAAFPYCVLERYLYGVVT
jgi:hypothetical protein